MEHGPRRGQARLAAYLAEADKAGLLQVPDPASAAESFFAMIHGNLFMERLMFPQQAIDPARIEAFVTAAVGIYLSGISQHPA